MHAPQTRTQTQTQAQPCLARPRARARLALVATVLLATLSAHAADEANDVAARVNGEFITYQQLDFEVQRQRLAQPTAPPPNEKAVLEELIIRRLLTQKAVELDMHTQRQAVLSFATMKEDFLARLYREQASPIAPATDAEVQRYYDEHPALFKNRRIYKIEAMDFKEPVFDDAGLSRAIKQAKSLPDLLKRHPGLQAFKFTTNSVTQPAEGLPLEVVDEFAKHKDGSVFQNVSASGQLSIYHLVMSRDAPVDLKTAAPLIRRYLWQTKTNEWFAAHTAELRKRAAVTISPR